MPGSIAPAELASIPASPLAEPEWPATNTRVPIAAATSTPATAQLASSAVFAVTSGATRYLFSVNLRVSWREIEFGIVPEDGSFELSELGPQLDPGALDQERSAFAIALERLELASGAVQGEHGLRA